MDFSSNILSSKVYNNRKKGGGEGRELFSSQIWEMTVLSINYVKDFWAFIFLEEPAKPRNDQTTLTFARIN